MTKQEFLQKLKEYLGEELGASQVNGQVSYYEQYIRDEVASGKSEAEVLDLLGDPWVIAKNILESPGSSVSQDSQEYSYTQDDTSDSAGYGSGYNSGGYESSGFGGFKPIPVWKKIAIVVGIILVIVVIFSIIGGVISLLAPVLFPVILILIVIQILGNIRK